MYVLTHYDIFSMSWFYVVCTSLFYGLRVRHFVYESVFYKSVSTSWLFTAWWVRPSIIHRLCVRAKTEWKIVDLLIGSSTRSRCCFWSFSKIAIDNGFSKLELVGAGMVDGRDVVICFGKYIDIPFDCFERIWSSSGCNYGRKSAARKAPDFLNHLHLNIYVRPTGL